MIASGVERQRLDLNYDPGIADRPFDDCNAAYKTATQRYVEIGKTIQPSTQTCRFVEREPDLVSLAAVCRAVPSDAIAADLAQGPKMPGESKG